MILCFCSNLNIIMNDMHVYVLIMTQYDRGRKEKGNTFCRNVVSPYTGESVSSRGRNGYAIGRCACHSNTYKQDMSDAGTEISRQTFLVKFYK